MKYEDEEVQTSWQNTRTGRVVYVNVEASLRSQISNQAIISLPPGTISTVKCTIPRRVHVFGEINPQKSSIFYGPMAKSGIL